MPIFALVGLVLAANAQAAPKHDAPGARNNSAQAQTQTVNPAPPPALTAIQSNTDRIAKALESQNARANSKDERQDAESDLQAQRDMAVAAKRAVWIGGIEAVATLMGVLLVGWTLYHTKRAADAARDATIKAGEAIAQSERHARQIQRAYIGVSIERSPFLKDNARIVAKMRNYGQTPAYNIHYMIFTGLADLPVSDTYVPYFHVDRKVPIKSVLNPDHEFFLNMNTFGEITDDIKRQIMDGERGLIVWGELRYQDVFREWHVTRFTRYCATRIYAEKGIFYEAPEGNDSD